MSDTFSILQNVIGFMQIGVSVVGGIVVASYWAGRSNKLAEYRYLDELYGKLLDTYRGYPEYGDQQRTDSYALAFRDDNALRYHYFAMTVHSVMETIFDVYETEIPEQWIHIFDYHTRMHAQW